MNKTKHLSIILAIITVLLLVIGFVACKSNYPVAPYNNNTMQTVTSFAFTSDGRARVHVDYTGYSDTTGAKITIRIERQSFLFFWNNILFQTYNAEGESYQNEFFYPIGKDGTYRCTVTYTVSGSGEDDVITFTDIKSYKSGEIPEETTSSVETPNIYETDTTAITTTPIITEPTTYPPATVPPFTGQTTPSERPIPPTTATTTAQTTTLVVKSIRLFP